jgi:hypothetical protein
MVAIDPGALWDVRSASVLVPLLELTSRLNTIVPSLATHVSDIAGPRSSTFGVVGLLDGDPRDAGRVVVIGDADVPGSHAVCRLFDDLLADATGADFAAFALAHVAIAGVEGVDVVDGAALGSGLRELDYEMKLRNLQDYQRRRSGREDQLRTSGQHISREALKVRITIPLILMVGPFGSVGAKFPWAKPMAVKLVPTRPMASTKVGLKMDMLAVASVVVCAC